MYAAVRPLLMALPAEASHDFALAALSVLGRAQLDVLAPSPVRDRFECLGLRFGNRVGLAAGLDKDGRCIEGLAAFGFGAIEVGTVTPRPQPGNDAPRMFRVPKAHALVNRMGFNNLGVDALAARIARRRWDGVLGVNIGKNKDTPAEQAVDDYVLCLRRVHAHADYVTVNLSSPNTPGLRDLQLGAQLEQLLDGLHAARASLAERDGRRVPMLVKIAPDLHDDDVAALCERLAVRGVDGVIATNTTIERPGVSGPVAHEAGGLSGAPLHERALEVVARVRSAVGSELAVFGVGGVDTPARAAAMVEAGADLVQLYTGLVYRGPALVAGAARAIRDS